MRTIKDLLKQQANPSKNLQQLLDDVEDKENTSQNSDSKPDHHSVKDFIHHEQSDLKKLLKRYEEDKRRYKQDKHEAEGMKYSDPSGYKRKQDVLGRVKEGIEKQIDKYNERLTKVKELERQSKNTQ